MKSINKILLNQFPVKLIFIFGITFQNLVFAEMNLSGEFYGCQFSSSIYDLKVDAGNDESHGWGYMLRGSMG